MQKFHYDDKGRKIYDVSNMHLPKPPKKEETKKNNSKDELSYLKKRENDPLKLKQNEFDFKETRSAYYCKICDCTLKDNQAYLDHINGKRHNQMLGMNMKVEKVGVEKVREKLLNLKRQNEKPMKSKNDLAKLIFSDKEKELEKIGNQCEDSDLLNKFKINN